VGCRICRHADRVTIEAQASTAALSDVAARFAVSERSLERHIRNVSSGVCALSSVVTSVDDEVPPTSRSPHFETPSGVRIQVDVDDRAVASTVLSELAGVRAGLERGLADVDAMIAVWKQRAAA
jgi:hypothetical protein